MSTINRVVKNTGYLYLKMGITVFISLYTTRLILNSLGASDFGIFNIVGGAIGMLGFLNSTLANATQRFMSYAEGKGDLEEKRKIFNVSLILHTLIAVATALLLLLAMHPLFNGIFNIEPDRIFAAKIVYLSLVVSTLLTIVNVPYDAVLNSHENMRYYSLVGVLEAFLKLAVAYACVYTKADKLIVYGVLMAAIPLLTLTVMKIYCHKHYIECIIEPIKYYDVRIVKEIASFSGWNFLTAISSLFSAQGIGIVLNHFFGAILNAAQGVAQQLNGQLSSFAANMMKALNPVIQKNAGMGNDRQMNIITIAGCKFSTYLVLLFAVPFIIEMPYVLRVWLKNVPDWAVIFCILQIVQTIICQMANSAATAVYAKGDIKGYAIYKSIMNLSPILVTYIAFKFGAGPIWLYIPMIAIWAIGGNIVIVSYANRKCNLRISDYVLNVVLPIILVAVFMFALGIVPSLFLENSFIRLLMTGTMTTMGMVISLLIYGLTSREKEEIRTFAKLLVAKRE